MVRSSRSRWPEIRSSAQAKGSKPAEKVTPAAVPIDIVFERDVAASKARWAAEKALLSWLAARAEEQGAAAMRDRLFFDTTEDEKAASLEIANVATRQKAAAKEMITAQERHLETMKAAPYRSLEYFMAAGHRADEAEKASGLPTPDDLHASERAGFEAWKQAQAEADRLEAVSDKTNAAYRGDGPDNKRPGAGAAPERDILARVAMEQFEPSASAPETFNPDKYLTEHSPKPAPKAAPTPATASSRSWHSWWCATNFFDHSNQACWPTKEDCFSKEKLTTASWHDCREESIVTIFEFAQVNGERLLMAFPLLSQCEKRRKAIMKNKVDYRDFSKCYSSAR
jgi:hypothetical protein